MKHAAILIFAFCLAACGQKTVLIEGTGVVQADPDVANVTAVVTTHEDTVALATQHSNRRVQAVLDYLKNDGFDPKSFGARNFSVRQSCGYDDGARKEVCKGFDATSTITIELTDLTKVGSVLASLSEFGVDIINPPNYGVRDQAKLTAQARSGAIADAKEQAKAYAEASGWHVGKIIGVESTDAVGSQYSRFRYLRQLDRRGINAALPPTNAIVVTGSRITRVPVTPDNVIVSDSVFVEFELQGSWNPFADKTWW